MCRQVTKRKMKKIFEGQFESDGDNNLSKNEIKEKLNEVQRPYNESILHFYELTNGDEFWDTKENFIRIWRFEDIREFNIHCESKNWAFADHSIFVGWYSFKIEGEDVKVYRHFESEQLIASSLHEFIKILETNSENIVYNRGQK